MKNENDVVMAYMTFPDQETADAIVSYLVEKRLVACINLMPATSYFRWDGEAKRENELVGVAKLTGDAKQRMEEEYRERHPYNTPSLVFYNASGGSEEYLDWISDSLKDGNP